MSECEHNWRLYEEESVRCTICDEVLDHPEDLAQELIDIFEDLGTMHGLKEQYRIKVEEMQAAIADVADGLERNEFSACYFMDDLRKFLPEEE